MPRSKSKRSTYTPPKPPKPKASPRWVPITGLAVIALGITLIIVSYIVPELFGSYASWSLVVGFVMMAGGLLLLSQWR